MQFKLVKTGKSYAEPQEETPAIWAGDITQGEEETLSTSAEDIAGVGERGSTGPPIIWETGNIAQIRSLLLLREAELVLAKAQLTGNRRIDWYRTNRILDLETKIADLKRWLSEALKGRPED